LSGHLAGPAVIGPGGDVAVAIFQRGQLAEGVVGEIADLAIGIGDGVEPAGGVVVGIMAQGVNALVNTGRDIIVVNDPAKGVKLLSMASRVLWLVCRVHL